MHTEVRTRRPPRVFAVILILIGLTLTVGGARLVSLGGSFYYVLAGIAVLASGVLLWRRDRRGSRVYGLLLVATVLWSLYEVGTDLWALAPRLLALLVIGAWFLTPWVRRSLYSPSAPPPLLRGRGSVSMLAGIFIAGVTAVVLGARAAVPAHEAKPPNGAGASETASTPMTPPAATGTDWQNYGNTTAGTRYVRIDQLTPDNVGKLQKIWDYRTGRGGAFKATPIQIGDLLYACTGGNVIVALDAETGEQRWRFDPQVNVPKIGNFGTTCRGVSYYRAPESYTGDCVERVVTATTDARLFAVDAKSGERCASFGRNGEPSGVVRAFDVLTGKFTWAWDMGRPGVSGEPAEGESYTRGTPNVWSLTSYDDALGLVYVPTGNETPDYYGGQRSQASEKYASSIVALDVATGEVRWSFQTVHHDIWDYDLPSQPVLFDLPQPDGTKIPALVQGTSAASCSCSIAAPARRSRKCASSRCHRAPCPATGPRGRSRSRSACRSSAAPISLRRTCGA